MEDHRAEVNGPEARGAWLQMYCGASMLHRLPLTDAVGSGGWWMQL
jgi:hypothetical protein